MEIFGQWSIDTQDDDVVVTDDEKHVSEPTQDVTYVTHTWL